uniref:Uncharacterized protein n=1 Tax=Lepeophtheirus salmonis TaxID=72036 RepID=A0A0K2VC77_LEPSM
MEESYIVQMRLTSRSMIMTSDLSNHCLNAQEYINSSKYFTRSSYTSTYKNYGAP